MSGRLFYLPAREGIQVLGLYSKNTGVCFATPPNCEHIAHATYLAPWYGEGKRANIDYFKVNGELAPGLVPIYRHNSRKKVIHDRGIPKQVQGVEQVFSTRVEIPVRFWKLKDAVREVMVHDIYEHALGRKIPETKEESYMRIVDEIDYRPQIRIIGDAKVQIWGKQTFYPECILDINLDFANWCIAGIQDGKIAPFMECDYCYSGYQHADYPNVHSAERKNLAEQFREARIKRAERGQATRYLRIGKKTEAGADIFREQVVETLEACLDEEIPAVFTTKFLSFDRDIADLLKRTNSSLLYSVGNDELERGAVMYGKTNEWRFEQLRRYIAEGVRAAPYVLVDAVEEDGGGWFRENFRRAMKFERAQILPVRIKGEAVARKILGSFYDVVGQHSQGLFDKKLGGYEVSGDNQRLAVRIHPSICNLVGNNTRDIGMCHHNSHCTWCRKCFVPGQEGLVIPTEHLPVLKEGSQEHKLAREKGIKVLIKNGGRPMGKKRHKYNEGETLFDMNELRSRKTNY